MYDEIVFMKVNSSNNSREASTYIRRQVLTCGHTHVSANKSYGRIGLHAYTCYVHDNEAPLLWICDASAILNFIDYLRNSCLSVEMLLPQTLKSHMRWQLLKTSYV